TGDRPESGFPENDGQITTSVDFWNGNRSAVRQVYERKVLIAILEATEDEWGAWEIGESLEEYPGDDEALVFTEKSHDLFVTIAGNQKFKEGDMIVIPHLLTKNLLGYRIPIIREEDARLFDSISGPEDIQKLQHGIPETWSDATIFRHNGYNVVEEGNFDDIFDRLQNGLFDYSAYGANEVLGVYENRASKREGLIIDQNVLLFYPFPLVFYINPDLPQLAQRIEQGLQNIIASGKLDAIFDEHYGTITEQLNLDSRRLFVLDNPLIPDEFQDLAPDIENLKSVILLRE
ncbi:MAG: transporter substrate-binding domain-containing protein, partial [Rhodothermaceae bacterium]|nr:transporter substrate-binding domain-containing protein [Rhodothermaceae bacterium]